MRIGPRNDYIVYDWQTDNYEGGNVMISIIMMFQCLKLQNFKKKFIF